MQIFRANFFFAALVLYLASGLGITAGAHRLWAHRSYKAKLPLKILLTIFNTIAFQDCAIHWARDHRVHHKYSETDADPHNATRYATILMRSINNSWNFISEPTFEFSIFYFQWFLLRSRWMVTMQKTSRSN